MVWVVYEGFNSRFVKRRVHWATPGPGAGEWREGKTTGYQGKLSEGKKPKEGQMRVKGGTECGNR